MPVKSLPTEIKSSICLTVNIIILEEVAMRINKTICVTAIMVLGMLSFNGIVLAQDEVTKTDKEFCEKEAMEAGLEGNDLQEYVKDCINDINAEKMEASKEKASE